MIKKLTKKSKITACIWGGVCIVIALVIMFAVFGNFLAYLMPAKDINEITADQLKDGMHVKGVITFVPDYYAYSTEGKTTIETEFVIPVGEEEYMGFVARGNVRKDAEYNMNLWWDYLDYGTDVTADDLREVKINGIVKTITGESLRYYNGYMSDLESETADLFVPYAVYNGIMAGQESSDSGFAIVIAVIVAGVGVVILLSGLLGNSAKTVTAYCKKQADPEYALQKIENFYQAGTPVQGIRAGDEFFMSVNGNAVFFAETSNILWAYQHTVQHRTNGIPTGKTYSIMVKQADGKNMQIPMANEGACQEALEYINRTMPYVIIGYDKSVETAYNRDRANLIQAVAERRSQFQGSATFENM